MAQPGHERDTHARSPRSARRPVVVAVPLALAATASAVTLGVVLQGGGDAATPTTTDRAVPAAQSLQAGASTRAVPETATTEPRAAAEAPTRAPILSRSQARSLGPVKTVEKKPNLTSEVVTRKAIREAKKAGEQLWVTDDLNLWTAPGKKSENDGELEAGRQVLVTGRKIWGRTEVVVQGRARWVTEGYLSAEEPLGLGAGLSDAPCAAGSSIEGGLQSGAVLVLRSVCNAFPEISTYGGRDNHGEHVDGKAVDIMTSDVELGTAIAEFLRAHAAELDLYNVIWRQRIFTQERAGEGWRGMPSRGSATADHYDHVHVSTY